MSQVKELLMWTDGGSRGNPGEAAIGIVIRDGDETLLAEGRYLGSLISNNQAEYQALYQGLVKARELGAGQIVCHLDSLLVVEQINGRYKVKDAGLREWWTKVKELEHEFDAIEVKYVPRTNNKEADALVNQALDNAV